MNFISLFIAEVSQFHDTLQQMFHSYLTNIQGIAINLRKVTHKT